MTPPPGARPGPGRAARTLPLAAALAIFPGTGQASGEPDTTELAPVVITATRSPLLLPELAGNASRIEGDVIERIQPTHPSELLPRVPGAWLNRGSGQEHLLAIRSPVLTGSGACGAFLLLENGVPVRPAGLCNVNGLFELNLAQADAVEVVRGPGGVLYGANALHGMVNVLVADPMRRETSRAGVMAGGDDYLRGSLDVGAGSDDSGWRVLGHAEHDDDYRERAGYDQQKINLGWTTPAGEGRFTATVAATNLNQETAGFILGFDAFRNETLSRSNPNPEAFRDTESARVVGRWQSRRDGTGADWRFYARRSRMDFLQHFLPGNPLEENGQDSAGLLYAHTWEPVSGLRVTAGADLDFADIFLVETQDEPVDFGPPSLRETRPTGRHYDFTVDSLLTATYGRVEHDLASGWRLNAGLRYERLQYDYDTRLPPGNAREDGTECGFGGCLFSRPADRKDTFRHLSPKLGMLRRLGADGAWYASLSRGFRPPQVTELYRLQRGQAVADLDEVRLDAIETGLRGLAGKVRYDVAVYAMRKSDVIFRDADGFNVSGVRTTHRGVELSLNAPLTEWLDFALDASYARHRYDSSHELERGGRIRAGDTVDTAPRLLADARLLARGPRGLVGELEAVHVDEYWLDPENEHRYGGHTLLNLRAGIDPTPSTRVSLVVTNLADRDYAERADFAFGDYRYFPGRPRSAYVHLTVSF